MELFLKRFIFQMTIRFPLENTSTKVLEFPLKIHFSKTHEFYILKKRFPTTHGFKCLKSVFS